MGRIARLTAVVSFVVAFVMALPAATGGTAETRLGDIKLPPGFRIATYAEVPNARSMTLGEMGTLFVGTRKGEVYAVLPGESAKGTHRGVTIARNMHTPTAWRFAGVHSTSPRSVGSCPVRRGLDAPVSLAKNTLNAKAVGRVGGMSDGPQLGGMAQVLAVSVSNAKWW